MLKHSKKENLKIIWTKVYSKKGLRKIYLCTWVKYLYIKERSISYSTRCPVIYMKLVRKKKCRNSENSWKIDTEKKKF